MFKFIWTEEKIQYLQENYNKVSIIEIAEKFNCKIQTIYTKASKLKLKAINASIRNKGKIRVLNNEEIEFIKHNYEQFGPKYCASKLGKKIGTINKISKKLGLKANKSSVIKNSEIMQEKLKIQGLYLKNFQENNKIIKKEEYSNIIDLYKKGFSIKEISIKYNCSVSPISKILKNIQKRKCTDSPKHFSKTQGYGEKHHSWKGGIKTIYDRFRDFKKYYDWRTSILIRDKRVCTNCNSSKNLEVHHKITIKTLILEYSKINNKNIKQFSDADFNSDFFYDLNNGITLCKNCHKEHHKLNGRK